MNVLWVALKAQIREAEGEKRLEGEIEGLRLESRISFISCS